MKLYAAAAFLALALLNTPAFAESYPIPYENTVATISVPDSWNPNASSDGIDAAAPGQGFFFSIYLSEEKAEADAVASATKIASNGDVMQIDLASKTETNANIGKVNSHEFDYKMVMEGKSGVLAINLVPLKSGGYLQVIRWGTAKGFAENVAHTKRIFATLRVKKR